MSGVWLQAKMARRPEPRVCDGTLGRVTCFPMTTPYGIEKLAERYDQFARWYDFGELPSELLIARRLRSHLLSRA